MLFTHNEQITKNITYTNKIQIIGSKLVMETMLAKIYTLDKQTLVLEVCTDRQIENILKLSTNKSPVVEIVGAENIAMSYEAKGLFIDILHKAKETFDNETSLGIRKIANNDILLTWKGANKQIISLSNLDNIKIGIGLGLCDEELLNLIPEKSNNYLKSYKFAQNHTDNVCDYLRKKYSNNISSSCNAKKTIASERQI